MLNNTCRQYYFTITDHNKSRIKADNTLNLFELLQGSTSLISLKMVMRVKSIKIFTKESMLDQYRLLVEDK